MPRIVTGRRRTSSRNVIVVPVNNNNNDRNESVKNIAFYTTVLVLIIVGMALGYGIIQSIDAANYSSVLTNYTSIECNIIPTNETCDLNGLICQRYYHIVELNNTRLKICKVASHSAGDILCYTRNFANYKNTTLEEYESLGINPSCYGSNGDYYFGTQIKDDLTYYYKFHLAVAIVLFLVATLIITGIVIIDYFVAKLTR